MNDFELLIFLLLWSAMILFLYEMFKSGAAEKILENFVNEIDPDVQRVTRCQNCQFYDEKSGFCLFFYDEGEEVGFKFTPAPDDYCFAGRKKEKDD